MTDQRAVSTTLNYALNLSLATLLIAGLLIAGGNFVQDQRKQTIRTELRVIGQQIAADVASVDRLARAEDSVDTASLNRKLPERVADSTYSVKIPDTGPPYTITLTSTNPDVSVSVNIDTQTNIKTPLSVSGGTIEIYLNTEDKIEVVNG
jgi:hypothetical protein